MQLAVTPESRICYEFPYRSEMPNDYVLHNPYLESLVYEAASLYSLERNPETLIQNPKSATFQSLYLKPFHAAQTIDKRLADASALYKYPLEQTPVSSCLAHVFNAECYSRVIVNQFCDLTYSGPGVKS